MKWKSQPFTVTMIMRGWYDGTLVVIIITTDNNNDNVHIKINLATTTLQATLSDTISHTQSQV